MKGSVQTGPFVFTLFHSTHSLAMRPPAIFAAMLRERLVCLSLMLTGIILVGANSMGVSLWRCSFHTVTGLPCPGCGMTRGMTALLRGRVAEAWHWHPFTPLIAVGGVLILACCLLPPRPRDRLAAMVERVEQRTGITIIAIVAMILFGLWRMFAYEQWP